MLSMTPRTSMKLLAPLRDRQAGPLLASFWAAELADGIISVLVPVAVYAVTQDVSAVALVFLGRMLLGIVMAHLGGWLADRYQRKYLLVANYLVRMLCATAILVWHEQVLFLAVLGIVLGALGAFDNPAAEAGVRSIFRHDLQAVAVMRNVGQTLSQMIGPALGGLLFGTVGVAGALWASIGLMVIAVLVIIPVAPLPKGSPREKNPPGQKTSKPEKPRLIGAVFMATFLSSFLVGVVVAVGVPHLEQDSSAPAGAYGYALAIYSFGAVIGGWVAGLIRWRDRHLPRVLLISAGAYGLIAAAGMLGPWWTILISWFAWGICFGPEGILTDRYVVARTPDRDLGRLYARWSNIGRLGAAAAYVSMLVWGTANPTILALVLSLGAVVIAPLLIAIPLLRQRQHQ
ncbi:permease [Paeniglutamicibacter gangotriensis Lz1y]|uniref:Permease n=2 Tax=Paeniglutamicibacter gangotriensis TaxID=254787 RepID=M7NIS3_9MICC|nr:permease [Paeniglutamicibacter gangotriensis Lz1y]